MIKCPNCGSTAQVKSSGIKRVNQIQYLANAGAVVILIIII